MTSLLSETPLTGTLAYNGFAWGPPNTTPPQLRVMSEVRYDEARRAVVGIDYRLEVSAILSETSETSAAAKVATLRETLQRPGKTLQITGLGFGDLQLEGDTQFGPKPLAVELTPIAGSGSWQLRWKAAFTLIEGATAASGDWLAFNFRTEYAIDDRGFTTRTITGHVRIISTPDPQTPGAISVTADSVRDSVVIAVPPGFRREQSRWTEDAVKSRLEFEVIDRELDHLPYPAGIVAGEVDFTVTQSTVPQTKAVAQLEGWLEHAANQPAHHSAERLLAIAADRAARLTTAAGGLLLPTRLELRRPLFARKALVRCEWERLGCLWEVLSASGLWEPVPGTDYATWRPSLEALWGNRGTASLASRLADGVIVDLADSPQSSAEIGASGGSISSPGGTWTLPALMPTVTEATSWRGYAARLEVVREEQATLHYPAQAVSYTGQHEGVGPEFSVTYPPLREVHGEPRQKVVFTGHAERIAFVPSVPRLVSAGGQPLVERGRTESREQVANLCGQPVYRTEWRIEYDVGGYLQTPTPPEIDGGG